MWVWVKPGYVWGSMSNPHTHATWYWNNIIRPVAIKRAMRHHRRLQKRSERPRKRNRVYRQDHAAPLWPVVHAEPLVVAITTQTAIASLAGAVLLLYALYLFRRRFGESSRWFKFFGIRKTITLNEYA
jgi:hypothetical protein